MEIERAKICPGIRIKIQLTVFKNIFIFPPQDRNGMAIMKKIPYAMVALKQFTCPQGQ